MLASFKIPRETVSTPHGTFDVRGLTFTDLSRLLLDYRDDLTAAAEIVAEAGDDLAAVAAAVAGKLPRLTAGVIACAADEPDFAGTAAMLPIPVQLDALIAIGRMTFTDEGAVPKFLANLQTLTAGLVSLKR